MRRLVLFICLCIPLGGGIAACGIKPVEVKPPAGSPDTGFPNTYPDLKHDPKPTQP